MKSDIARLDPLIRAENLAVLCLECHNETQINGGFGRKLNAPSVIKYRDEWLGRVKLRRALADEAAVKREVGKETLSEQVEKVIKTPIKHTELKEPASKYINSLPYFKAALLHQVQLKWDTGVTATMVQANYDYIDSLTGILVALASYYSPKQFGNQTPQEYFSDVIASRFQWYRTILEPHGPGGTIVNVICSGSVLEDTENMIEDMVRALARYDDEFDWENWSKRWQGEKI
ncbi:hypothetical protein ES708_10461 [subsurface metagenome]